MASPTPVLPAVGSAVVPPGASAPSASAASTIRVAMRSFTDPPGFRYSTLASTNGLAPSVVAPSLRSGVLPMRSMREFTYCTQAVYGSPIPSPHEEGRGGEEGCRRCRRLRWGPVHHVRLLVRRPPGRGADGAQADRGRGRRAAERDRLV